MTTVFTNGCFDLIHAGHVDLLERARHLGTKLIVGINSDRSVRAIKGPDRPLVNEEDRKRVLLGLRSVDEVIIFDETTPERLIRELRPDVLVKGGDWKAEEIIGADFVTDNGGQVLSLPLMGDHSTSSLLGRITNSDDGGNGSRPDTIAGLIREHISVFENLLKSQAEAIEACGDLICETFRNGKKILVCGNGGSAADAQHLAAEFVGRFESERAALPAIALTTDTSALTAIANDYEFARVFARQVEALGRPGDCLIAISTSGNASNVLAAAMAARKLGCNVIALTGQNGKKLAGLSDIAVMVPSGRTANIQEAHISIAHIWCGMVDSKLGSNQ